HPQRSRRAGRRLMLHDVNRAPIQAAIGRKGLVVAEPDDRRTPAGAARDDCGKDDYGCGGDTLAAVRAKRLRARSPGYDPRDAPNPACILVCAAAKTQRSARDCSGTDHLAAVVRCRLHAVREGARVVPTRLSDRYVLHDELAAGGMATVYLGRRPGRLL